MNALVQQTGAPVVTTDDDDPFRYGWRYVRGTDADGRETWEQIPLTLEDVLHPEEGDFIVQGPQHLKDCTYLAYALETQLKAQPTTLVACDRRIDWGRPDIGVHGPDIVVFFDVPPPHDIWKVTFYVQQVACRIGFAIEIVSPLTRTNDVDKKLVHYRQIGVPLYVLVDQEKVGGPRSVVVYQLIGNAYVRQPLSAGRYPLPGTGLFIGLENDIVALYDASGQRIPDYDQQTTNARTETSRANAAEQRATVAEQRAQEAATARAAAEQRAQAEAAARALAVQQAQEAATARAAAEQRAQQEAQLRQALEAQLRALQEQLQRRVDPDAKTAR